MIKEAFQDKDFIRNLLMLSIGASMGAICAFLVLA